MSSTARRFVIERQRHSGHHEPVNLLRSLPQVLEAFFQGGNLSEPDALARLVEPGFGVDGHLFKAAGLRGVDLEEWAPGAGVLVHARGAIGAVAVAEGDLAQQEVLLELVPLIGGGHAQ